MHRTYAAIGLMSGTSMDGIDAVMLLTDGRNTVRRLHSATLAYDPTTRKRINRVAEEMKNVEDRDARPGIAAEVERELTLLHARIVETICRQAKKSQTDIDVIGFHGQTVLHRPDRGLTVQLGDGHLLAALTGIDVVSDFRHADMVGGGQGAPLVPVYHAALARMIGVPHPVVFVNIGGVANITWVSTEHDPIAFDTGPGNALLDDWCSAHTGLPMDQDGRIAARGSVHNDVLSQLLDHPFFDLAPPKSLDRGDFSNAPANGLTLEDGAATLAAFTAESIAASARWYPSAPQTWVVCGGGRRNPVIMAGLRSRATGRVLTGEDVGLNGDDIEAEAFAYLAVRSLESLPLTFPLTTGVAVPTSGGQFHPRDQAACSS